MPYFINTSGVVVNVNPENVEKALRDGLRPVTEEDMNWARGDRSRFALPAVDGYERGCMGDAPIIVLGGGPSKMTPTPGLFRIQSNPRANDLPCDVAIALDGVYWDMDHYWKAYKDNLTAAGHKLPQAYCPRYVHYKCQDPIRHFNMPVRVIRGQADEYLELRTQRGIQKAHFTAICAVLFAQYLSTGPVILLGNDFVENDAAGNDYLKRQYPSWEAAAGLWTNVYMHKANSESPVKKLFPIWEHDFAAATPAKEQ